MKKDKEQKYEVTFRNIYGKMIKMKLTLSENIIKVTKQPIKKIYGKEAER